MATHYTTPLTALAIAARLVRANIPFTINVLTLTRADIECKFEDVLGEAVMQQYREDNRGHAKEEIFGTETARLPLCDDGDCDHAATPREGECLNDWEEATHQITFDNGANWTNVKLKYGYYLACSDGKRSWRADSIDAANVVKRPEAK